ncbi:hypothetical protein [Actinomycetospora chiangmaiensis]|uniref:hypothetical protein n=1 Tax=Actinomycetospora chiangmaiensis TaxID=402650 RepID=UPI000374347D|nr:hypothetical protein [Actinomycetospora chiangmaiensis]
MPLSPAARRALVVANVAGAVGSSAFAAAGALRPDVALPDEQEPVGARTRFWAAASGIRTWAICAPLVAGLATGRSVPQLLIAAGTVQLGDSVLGIGRRDPAMTTAPLLLGIAHLVSARALRPQPRPATEPSASG